MKTLIATIVAVCLVFPLTARACWVSISLEDFVKENRLIVVGEIIRVIHAPNSRYLSDTAFIKVERVLKNSLKKAPKVGSEISLSMPSASNERPLSTDIYYSQGQRGIWLLNFEDGKYHAGQPLAFQPLSEQQKVKAAMKGEKSKLPSRGAGR